MIKVLHPGFYSTIQDLGRENFQHIGVPISGAMDLNALNAVNAILGNHANCAVLEIAMLGPKLEFSCDTSIAITGANMSPQLNNNRMHNYTLINVSKGDILSFGKLDKGFRSYMAVSGGLQTECVLKSRSMYTGITQSSQLRKGDILNIKPVKHLGNKYSSIKFNKDYLESSILEVYKGPEFDTLSNTQQELFFNQEFTISKDNNRMAYQLKELIQNDLEDIITSLVLPGTVQLTPSGKLIVLMRDCQTTGGYPRVLQLSEASINTLAQKFTGNNVTFRLMS